MSEVAKRIEWIDTAKGIGILMVMLGHNYLDWKFVFWCYSCHMALFFFLSGCTFKYYADFKSFLKKKVQGLLVPYWFFAVLISIYNWISAVTHNNSFGISDALLSYLSQIRYTHLWFLPCLFLAEIGTWIVHKYIYLQQENIWLLTAGVQNIIFFAYRSLIGIDLPWNADLAVLGMSFMSLGLWYQAKADPFISNKQLRLSIIITAVIFHVGVSWLVFITTESVDWYSNRFGNPVFFTIGACTGIFATILISKRFHFHELSYLGANSIVW